MLFLNPILYICALGYQIYDMYILINKLGREKNPCNAKRKSINAYGAAQTRMRFQSLNSFCAI